MDVILNDFRRQWAAITTEATAVFDRVGSSGWYILGNEVLGFEQRLAEHWGMEHCVGTGNGLDAIEIGLRCSGIQRNDMVLTTPLSAFATTLAILRCGATPVFVDVDERGLLDLGLCRDLLDREPAIGFMVPVHLFGSPMDLEELLRLRDTFHLKIVEDCAQSIGASWSGRATGTVGDAAATSFYPTKNLGCLGDGGALLTNLVDIDVRARALRHYGQTSTYIHDHVGLNSRLDELQAALLADVMLPRLRRWTGRRIEIATRYRSEIDNPNLRIPHFPAQSESVSHLFPVLTAPDTRASFRAALESAGIQTGVHYPVLIPDQNALRRLGEPRIESGLEHATDFAENEVSLPIHPFLDDSAVDAIISACNRWSA